MATARLGVPCQRGDVKAVQTLIKDDKLDPNGMFYTEGFIRPVSPLHISSNAGHLDLVKYLVQEAGANPNGKDGMGHTAILFASRRGHVSVMRWLVEAGLADINLVNHRGWNALHLASRSGHLEIVKWLVQDVGIDPDLKDNDGWTAVHHAVSVHNCNREVLLWLVNKGGANPRLCDACGWTPLHTAAQRGHLEAASFLVLHNRDDLDRETSDGYRPINVVYSLLKSPEPDSLDLARILITESSNLGVEFHLDGLSSFDRSASLS